MILNNICLAWNSLYTKHLSEYREGDVSIFEKGDNAKNKRLKILCDEVVAFPTKEFDSYNLFSALSNRNCDGALLVKNDAGSYDLLYIEMKSRFSSEECFEAKCQITETRVKLVSLFRMMKTFTDFPIRKVYGVIEFRQLDEDQELLWMKMQQLPDDELDFGWKLFKYGTIMGKMLCNTELEMPSEMPFRILLSNSENYTVQYKDLCDSLEER